MRKLASIILLFLYLSAVSGVTISQHFCCGRLSSVAVQLAIQQTTGHLQHSSRHCCDSDALTFHINAPQQVAQGSHVPAIPTFTLFVYSGGTLSLLKKAVPTLAYYPECKAPPLYAADQPLFLFQQSLLI